MLKSWSYASFAKLSVEIINSHIRMFYCYISQVLAIPAVCKVPVVLILQQILFRTLLYLIKSNLSSLQNISRNIPIQSKNFMTEYCSSDTLSSRSAIPNFK